jgi:hypothetical protein
VGGRGFLPVLLDRRELFDPLELAVAERTGTATPWPPELKGEFLPGQEDSDVSTILDIDCFVKMAKKA